MTKVVKDYVQSVTSEKLRQFNTQLGSILKVRFNTIIQPDKQNYNVLLLSRTVYKCYTFDYLNKTDFKNTKFNVFKEKNIIIYLLLDNNKQIFS